MGRMVTNPATRKKPLFPKLTCGTYAEPYLYGYSGGGVGK